MRLPTIQVTTIPNLRPIAGFIKKKKKKIFVDLHCGCFSAIHNNINQDLTMRNHLNQQWIKTWLV